MLAEHSGVSTLRVEPATAAHLRALLAEPDEFTRCFGLAVIDGYVEFNSAIERSLAWVSEGLDPQWGSQLFIHGPDAAVIGLGGYKGPPVDDTIEIGYGIAPAYRRQGHATTAVRLLAERACQRGVRHVVAHTLAQPNTSNRLLARLGFLHVADVEDADAGTVWRWELQGAPPPTPRHPSAHTTQNSLPSGSARTTWSRSSPW